MTHILVADGRPTPEAAALADQHIVLHRRHDDGGNAGRMAGGLSAASQRFDAVTFLDPADWFLPGHLSALAAAVAGRRAEAATARRLLHRIDGTPAAPCREVDGVRAVDSSGILLLPPAFPAIAMWSLAPAPVAGNAAQAVLAFLQGRGRTIAAPGPTAGIAKRVRARAFNAPFGPTRWDAWLTDAQPPSAAAVGRWWNALEPAARDREIRRMGLQ